MSNTKNSNFGIVIITIVITVVVVLVIINYGTIVKVFYPPDPVIVSNETNGSSSTLFEYSVKVQAVIRNDGGNGDIVFEATVYQEGNNWTKSVKKYFEAKETKTVELIFDEVKFFKGDIHSEVKAYPFGK
jgi:hypothetical protein